MRMRTTAPADERPLIWIASSKRDLKAMPGAVIRQMGFALGVAQNGGTHPRAKPWKGEGPGVFEIVRDFDGNTFRGIYTVRFREAVYVLHCFQKKSSRDIGTARSDIRLVRARLQVALEHYKATYGQAND
jgi:phage-related protein